MTFRILGLAALMALFTGTLSTKAFAEEGTDAAVASEEMSAGVLEYNAEDPAAAPRWRPRPPQRGNFVCYSRNIRGRTFAAYGNWRTPARWVQDRALDQCRRQSGFLRFSCRNIGCRR